MLNVLTSNIELVALSVLVYFIGGILSHYFLARMFRNPEEIIIIRKRDYYILIALWPGFLVFFFLFFILLKILLFFGIKVGKPYKYNNNP